MTKTIISEGHATIVFQGKRIPWGQLRTSVFIDAATADLKEHDLDDPKLQRLLLPSVSEDEGFRGVIHHPNNSGTSQADGMILNKSGQALAVATRDCLSVVVTSPGGQIGFAHGARAALAPRPTSSDILSNLLGQMKNQEKFSEGWKAHLIGGICGTCFEHEPNHIDVLGFQSQAGRLVIKELSNGKVGLDLPAWTHLWLQGFGFLEENIIHDGECTHSNIKLGSKRREREGDHNLTIIYRH